MNRAERRHPKKPIDVRQVLRDFSTISKMKKAIEDGWQFEQGDKVQLDLEKIREYPDYGHRLPAYRKFCEENADRVFTVEYNEDMNPSVVCFAEDESKPKWFFWVGDLKAVK